MGGFIAVVTAIAGTAGAGAIYLPKTLRDAAAEAGESAARKVTDKVLGDVIVLQQQQATSNATLLRIERGLESALDFMSEQARIEAVILRMVKQESLKK